MKIFEGTLAAQDYKIAIVTSRFNEFIVSKLLEGALDCLYRHGAVEENISLFKVPGSFEIPVIAEKIAQSGKYDGIICLGALIRGNTPHFDYISSEVTKGIAATSLKHTLPISFGVLTTDSIEQAIERAGTKAGNKGWDAALSAIEMISLFKGI
jgi:6,7-dimethyl-8-ribityllumazine synthase